MRESLSTLLKSEGFITTSVDRGSKAIKSIEKSPPDLIVLDLFLPDIGGEAVCKFAREYYPDTKILMLTAKSTPQDVAQGLLSGADDYLTKPFQIPELIARIKAVLRRTGSDDQSITIADLTLDPKSIEVKRAGKKIPLTRTEFNLLRYLMSNKGQILTRDMILNHVWAYNSEVESRVVDVYIGYLRKKVDSGHSKKLIISKRGFGYGIDTPK